jgi:hypothetical protein
MELNVDLSKADDDKPSTQWIQRITLFSAIKELLHFGKIAQMSRKAWKLHTPSQQEKPHWRITKKALKKDTTLTN